jgi:hypothetical protein
MIQPLLSLFKTYPEKYCTLSETGKRNTYSVSNLNFYYSSKAIMILSILWIIYHVYYYQSLLLRPEELFIQKVWFGKIFLPSFPSPFLFYSVSAIGIVLILSILVYKDHWIVRFLILFIILWINLVRWSCGGESLSSHLLMLSHLFALGIPVASIKKNKEDGMLHKTLTWFYLGLLITYVLSGFWKVSSLIYKLIFKQDEMTWLSSKAALFTSQIAYHLIDQPADSRLFLFNYPLIWQAGFLLTCYILLFSFVASYRPSLRFWIGLALIVFHQINNIAFDVVHYVSSFTLLCLFFPYQELLPSINKTLVPITTVNFSGKKGKAFYQRIYSNGDQDVFYGFYAYREKMVDQNAVFGGILYMPLLDALLNLAWGGYKKKSQVESLKA